MSEGIDNLEDFADIESIVSIVKTLTIFFLIFDF